MKILYELDTPWPTDVGNPDGFEAVTWHQHGAIPFVPFIGLEIDCGDGDLRTVQRVYWSARGNELSVFFEDETARPMAYWSAGGWRSDDLPTSAPVSKRKTAKRP